MERGDPKEAMKNDVCRSAMMIRCRQGIRIRIHRMKGEATNGPQDLARAGALWRAAWTLESGIVDGKRLCMELWRSDGAGKETKEQRTFRTFAAQSEETQKMQNREIALMDRIHCMMSTAARMSVA